MTILGVRNKTWYLHFVLNLAVVLFSVGRETKTYLTHGRHKPRNPGTNVSPSSPASVRRGQARMHPWSSWRAGTTGSAEPKASFSNCWWHHVLAGTQVAGSVPRLQGGHHRDTHKRFALPSLHCMHFFFPSPANSSKRFCFSSSTWQTFLPTSNGQTPFSGLQMHEEHRLCFQTFQCLKIRRLSVQILILLITVSIVSSQSLILPLPSLIRNKKIFFFNYKKKPKTCISTNLWFVLQENKHILVRQTHSLFFQFPPKQNSIFRI